VEEWYTANLRRLRLGEEKRKKKTEETTGQKYNGLFHRVAIITENLACLLSKIKTTTGNLFKQRKIPI